MREQDTDHIARLETTIAHQQQEIHDLSDMVDILRKDVETLKARLDRTQKHLIAMEDTVRESGGEGQTTGQFAESQKPPHY